MGLWRFLKSRWSSETAGPSRPASESQERARLSFLLQQQEAELQTLKKILLDAQSSLHKAEEERRRWSDLLNNRRGRLDRPAWPDESEDRDLESLGRDRQRRQRAYESHIEELLEKLKDLQKRPPPVLLQASTAPPSLSEKGWLLERQGLQERLREEQEKASLAEQKREAERALRLEAEKRLAAREASQSEVQEKLRNAEAALWQAQAKSAQLEKEKASLQSRVSDLQETIHRMAQESQPLEPAALSQEMIDLRQRVQELESREGVQRLLAESQKALELESAARRAAEESAAALTRQLEGLRIAVETERAQWREQGKRLEGERDRERDGRLKEEAARQVQEERAARLQEDLSRREADQDREKALWQAEAAGLREETARLKAEAARLKAELAARPEPSPPPADPETSSLLEEVDRLAAENAALSDEVRFLRSGGKD